MTVYLNGPWVFKAGSCPFCGGGHPVRWRLQRLRVHQTVEIDFGIQGTPTRFAQARALSLKLPGMVIQKNSTANRGNADPQVRYHRDSYELRLTSTFHWYAGPNQGGFGGHVFAVVADPSVTRVCPELRVRFSDSVVTHRSGCWRVTPPA
jgi:hypothetical protein